MQREFKIMAGKYVIVEYCYSIEIPGTTGTKLMTYWIAVADFEKKSVEDALMKFAVEAANLPHSEHIKVTKTNSREIKKGEYRL